MGALPTLPPGNLWTPDRCQHGTMKPKSESSSIGVFSLFRVLCELRPIYLLLTVVHSHFSMVHFVVYFTLRITSLFNLWETVEQSENCESVESMEHGF